MNNNDPLSPEEKQELENLLGDMNYNENEENPAQENEEEDKDAPVLGYRRPSRRAKKSRTAGLASFILSLLSLLLLGVIAINLFLAYKHKTLAIADARFTKIGVVAAAACAALALIIGIITLFLRKQKKAFAVTGIVLSLLIAFSSGAAIYIYQYTFGSVNHQEMDEEDLHAVEAGSDGEIDWETEEEIETLASEEIENLVEEKRKELGEDVEWEFFTDEDLPKEALDKMNTNSQFGKSYLLDGHERISNFLLLGIDKQESSDALMVCTVDRVHHKIKLISIPRDSYVLIPEFGTYAKLTYAFVWGGAPWTIGTVNRNFHLNVSDYIAVDFEQLKSIIDMVGGVDVDLSYQEVSCLPYGPNLCYGKCHLNGEQGLAYARIRSIDSEEDRTGRQREVVMSILNSLSRMPMTDYPAFIRQCLEMSETSFESEELLELSMEVMQNHYSVEQYALISRMDYWGGILGDARYFYVVYDLNRASDQLYRIIYEDLYVSGYKD